MTLLLHSQCPTNVAAAVANAPHHKHTTPSFPILSLSNFQPASPPRVCCVVFKVSMGVRIIRNAALDKEAATVLISTGQVREARRERMKALAAVSPNRASGPWNLYFSIGRPIRGWVSLGGWADRAEDGVLWGNMQDATCESRHEGRGTESKCKYESDVERRP